MACVYCNMLMHELCASFDQNPCCCGGKGYQGDEATVLSVLTGGTTKWQKDRSLMADPTSAGRKRAAVEIPDSILNGELVCEWAGLLFAGGGVEPIVGCGGRSASDRHHGPDKCVLNNVRGTNLWAICDHCHNRWHAVNDKYYVPAGWRSAKLDGDPRPKGGDPWLPNAEFEWSEPDTETKAPPELIQLHELWWGLSNYERNTTLGGNFREYARQFGHSISGQSSTDPDGNGTSVDSNGSIESGPQSSGRSGLGSDPGEEVSEISEQT